jgi:hypothetical protein
MQRLTLLRRFKLFCGLDAFAKFCCHCLGGIHQECLCSYHLFRYPIIEVVELTLSVNVKEVDVVPWMSEEKRSESVYMRGTLDLHSLEAARG